MALRLLVLVGPTASGKTRFGVEVAHALGSEIVSADSRQVYRGLDVGSGKDLEEYRRVSPPVRYHLIDVADPRSIYTLFHYQRDCYALLSSKSKEAPFRDGVPLMMVGGTGLFVEAVLRGFRIPNVPEDVELRRRMMRRPAPELVAELRELDPERFRDTDLSSKKRVVRALEIVRASRRGPIRTSDAPPPFEFVVFGVDLAREELHRRIDRRLDARLRAGLVAEVEALLVGGLSAARLAQLGLEYREAAAFLTGKKSETRMIEDLRRGIRRLAKRQRTWFRGLPRRGIPVRWVEPDDRSALLNHRWPSGA